MPAHGSLSRKFHIFRESLCFYSTHLHSSPTCYSGYYGYVELHVLQYVIFTLACDWVFYKFQLWPYRKTTSNVVKWGLQARVTSSCTCEVVQRCRFLMLVIYPHFYFFPDLFWGQLQRRRDWRALATLNHSLHLHPSATELLHKLQPSANLRNSVNVDLYLWAVLKVYYN